MAQKDRKIHTNRGTRNCGYGNTQKHRGSGSRGGRGMGGSNKQKWSYVSKYMPGHFGRAGFKRPQKMLSEEIAINVGDLDMRLEELVETGAAQLRENKYLIDLTSMGYDKLLGSGKATRPMEIKVDKASKSAAEKVEKAGGRVETPEQAAEAEAAPQQQT
ncbi:MAG: 50S ribosomal protein L15 [Candidatus Altiarchaeota archaeon]|nr:50S ribosomal protein L15 [Candidatus Altiarchaeota archaeon]